MLLGIETEEREKVEEKEARRNEERRTPAATYRAVPSRWPPAAASRHGALVRLRLRGKKEWGEKKAGGHAGREGEEKPPGLAPASCSRRAATA
jgi:hypothetical protein